MKKILTALLAGLVAAGSFATVSSAAIAKLEEAPTDAMAQFEDGTIVWIANSGFSGETADNLFDDDPQTKWCHGDAYSYVVWELPEAVSITGYQIVTASDNAEWPGRNPGNFILYGCNDYDSEVDEGSWEAIDTVEDSVAEGLEDLNWAAFTFTDFDVAEVPAYKYYMFEINSVVGGGIMQMSGLNLVYEGKEAQVVDPEALAAEREAEEAAAKAAERQALIDAGWTPNIELAPIEGITVVSFTEGFSEAEGAASLFDYDDDTKYCTATTPNEVIWEMPNAVAITGYQIVTANDNKDWNGRSPMTWTLSGSTDGSAWTEIDSKTGDTTILEENFLGFDFMLDSAAPAYKFFKLNVEELGGTANGNTTMQMSGFNLIFDGAEAVVEETEAVVEETEAVVEETEAVVEETEAVEEVVETEAPAEETEAAEEVVETVETKEETTAPQTFDAVIIAGVAAVVSLAGYAVSKKH